MKYLSNFSNNVSVELDKDEWNKDKYTKIKKIKLLQLNVETQVDNQNDDFNSINSSNSQIADIKELADNLLIHATIDDWQGLVNQIKQPINNNNQPISQEDNKQISQEKLYQYFNNKNYSLSQMEILSFCGKLLDILQTGDIPLQTQSDKYEYLKQYFEVKSKIAKIQNILLVREILHREDSKNKDNETAVYGNNEQKIQKQKEELELVINANYLAFQSSIQEYKQLKKEIDDIKTMQ